MASTNRTPNLGLNSWIGTDKPKRVDFVSDNSIIDSVLGGHISNETAHLTSCEKDKVDEPFEVVTVYGTGNSSTNYTFDFEPSMVIAFKKNASLFEYSASQNKINCAIATKRGSSSGISLSSNMVMLYQGSVTDTAWYNNMNEQYSQYIVIAYK